MLLCLKQFKSIIKDFIYRCIPDKFYLMNKFYKTFGYKINLKKPQTYNEKLQWIKLYDRNPIYTKMVDKYKVRKIVEERIGQEYLIPLLGVWEKFDNINFDLLPEKFVLKTNHDSGGVWIIEKNKMDYNLLRNEVNKHLKTNFYWKFREWPYKRVKPLVIAEKYITDETGKQLKDYKFYCFNGQVKLIMRASNRQSIDTPTQMDYFNENLETVKMTWGYPANDNPAPLPKNINELKTLASKLAEGINEVRVDLYTDTEKIYFGELTFFDGAGFDKIEPQEWDFKLGSYITII